MVSMGYKMTPERQDSQDRHRLAEERMEAMISEYGWPIPDEIEHTETTVRFRWHDRKVVVVVDLNDM